MSDVDRIADYLFDLRQSHRTVPVFPAELMPADEAMAYRVQDRLTEKLLPGLGPIVGYKIGLTSQAIRQQTGLDHPIVGPIFAENQPDPTIFLREFYLNPCGFAS